MMRSEDSSNTSRTKVGTTLTILNRMTASPSSKTATDQKIDFEAARKFWAQYDPYRENGEESEDADDEDEPSFADPEEDDEDDEC